LRDVVSIAERIDERSGTSDSIGPWRNDLLAQKHLYGFIALKDRPMAGKEVMPIESTIVSVRGHRVIPASDLASI
jgi:hypothetical protein